MSSVITKQEEILFSPFVVDRNRTSSCFFFSERRRVAKKSSWKLEEQCVFRRLLFTWLSTQN